jgi:hypothetical protein
VLQVVPYVVTNGLNGLNYVSFGTAGGKVASAAWGLDANADEARRLPFWKGEADGAVKAAGAAASSQCKYAIMVFGSQQGGGYALLGAPTTSAGRLTRNPTTNDTWLGSNAPNYDFTVDGETVNPGTAKPNGAWQIVSIDMTRKDTKIDSFGAQTASGSSATAPGGQNYAEVILFESAPTEAERRACERDCTFDADGVEFHDMWGKPANVHGTGRTRRIALTGEPIYFTGGRLLFGASKVDAAEPLDAGK